MYVKPSIRSHRVFEATAPYTQHGGLTATNPSLLFPIRHPSIFLSRRSRLMKSLVFGSIPCLVINVSC